MARQPSSLKRSISPPPPSRKASTSLPVKDTVTDQQRTDVAPTLAAIEAGQAQIRDHLSYFASHFASICRGKPNLSIDGFKDLYQRNQHAHGRHFVVHQHDHPISGVHYDLRLQFSASSTISFAIPYGLPGNPNTVRPIRMAIETRVHNLWNNLIESASHATGSLLIWDTGEYEVLPSKEEAPMPLTDDELSEGGQKDPMSNSERLCSGFQSRHIRLRLQGQKLPPGYAISIRLPLANDSKKHRARPVRKRRRTDPAQAKSVAGDATDSETETKVGNDEVEDGAAGIASDIEEDAMIRAENAYPGSANTIGSVHQRKWMLRLDKENSGFRKARNGPDEGRWIGGWEPFVVRGRDRERSVVTGRTADEVMEDEGVEKFVGRKMWRPIVE